MNTSEYVVRNQADELRAALAFRGIKHDPKALKPQLQQLLSKQMNLPAKEACPASSMPEQPNTSSAHEEMQCNDDGMDDDIDDDSGDSDDADVLSIDGDQLQWWVILLYIDIMVSCEWGTVQCTKFGRKCFFTDVVH